MHRENALAAYDALLQRSPQSAVYQRGRLEALRSLGMFDNVAMLVRAALPPPTRVDGASRELLAHGVEAAWRMGHWPLLDEFLARPEARFENMLDAGLNANRGTVVGGAARMLCFKRA